MNIINYYIIITIEDYSETWRISNHNLCCSSKAG